MARVLIVEDEALIAEDLRRTLGRLGYEVSEPVGTGQEALTAARDRRPDLVLMDIRLSGAMDGIDAAREMRRRFDLPVVFLTAHSDDATIVRAKDVEPYGYLLKPFDDRELRTTIELALHKHRVDARLGVQQRWIATTLDCLADAVIATDTRGTIRLLNHSAERLTNWKREDAIGLPVEQVFRVIGPDGSPVPCPIREAIRSSSPAGIPARSELAVKGGRVIGIDDTAAPIRDDDGKLLGGVVVFRDTTEKRRLERRLVLAERLAAVGMLSAGVAHEINNPLTYVVGNLSLALEALEASNADLARIEIDASARAVLDAARARLSHVQELLREAGEGADRVKQIARDLRHLARPEAEERRPLALQPLLDTAVKMTSHVVSHHARLVTDYGPTPRVEGVEGSLIQVFVNLMLNAAQAIPAGDAEHQRIVIRSSTQADGRAVVEVSDSGRGIPRDMLERIFEPFFSTKPGETGMGLGLAICRSVLDAHGGDITAKSEPGAGTTFRVTLPPAAVVGAEIPPSPAPGRPARRGRVLVVDDDPAVGTTLQRILRRDHDVTVVTEGRDALARIDAGETYDVVLCDLMMPVMSGMEVHHAVAARHPAQARRIVFMTGGTFTAGISDFVARVPNRVLWKPFTVEAIRAAVRDLVDEGPA